MNVIDRQELGNGVVLTSYDDSKSIVGDRWQVRIRFVVVIPWDGWMDVVLQEEGVDSELVQNSEGDLSLEMTKERIFVSEESKEEVMAEVVAEMNQNVLTYLAKPIFIEKFFRKRLAEVREQLNLAAQRSVSVTGADDEDEPADFSSCFK